MNYFKVNGVVVVGNNVSLIEVECVQQRRLPYLQIIGGSAGAMSAQRERITAALESSGFRLPARRITVSLTGTTPNISLEGADLAVALAILGSIRAFPSDKLSESLVCGALSLDGKLRPLACRAPLRAWLGENKAQSILLPWEDSQILGEEGTGGGFHSLLQVVEYLRKGISRGPRCVVERKSTSVGDGERASAWGRVKNQPYAQRVAQIAAAGGHSLLLSVERESDAQAVARATHSLLPVTPADVAEEIAAIRTTLGEFEPTVRPFREVRSEQVSRMCRLDPASGLWGELSLAHGGVLFLPDLGDRPASLLGRFLEPLRSGAIRSLRGGRSSSQPADWILIARAASCPCGEAHERSTHCRCQPAERERYRQQMARSAPVFQLHFRTSEIFGVGISWADAQSAVARVHQLRASRQCGWNSRLTLEELRRVKPWSAVAEQLWRLSARSAGGATVSNLARLALTISDLRGAAEVGKADVLEARHYEGLTGSSSVAGSNNFSSTALPERNSTAIP